MHKDEMSFARKMATEIEEVVATEELEAVAGGSDGSTGGTFQFEDPAGAGCPVED